jgi:AAA domain/Bifunctional DNA primase/polymerase, N-terminal/Primase C terminal 1 (PriCT-1)
MYDNPLDPQTEPQNPASQGDSGPVSPSGGSDEDAGPPVAGRDPAGPGASAEDALKYLKLGLSIVPCRYRDKRPTVAWERYKHGRAAEAEIAAWFPSGRPMNIAIVCGAVSGGFVAIDFDDRDVANDVFPPGLAGTTVVVKTGKAGHIWLKSPGYTKNMTIRRRHLGLAGDQEAPVIEIRAEGSLVVAPPSAHPSGKPYSFIEGCGREILEVPDVVEWLRQLLAKAGYVWDPTPEAGVAILSGNGDDWFTRTWCEPVLEGSRNNTLFRLACHLSRERLTYSTALPLCSDWNHNHCSPPLDDGEVARTVESAYSYHSKPHGIQVAGDTLPIPAPMHIAEAMAVQTPADIWLVDGLVVNGGNNVWPGHPGSGKTWALLDLALAVASGQPFLGHPTKQTGVLLCDEDNILRLHQDRIPRLAEGRGLDLSTLPFYIHVQHGVDCLRDEWIDHILDVVRKNGIGLVIFEVLRRIFQGDENSSADIAELHRQLARIRTEAGATIILSHHLPKNQPRATSRGSGDIEAGADVILLHRQTPAGFAVTQRKNRWAPALKDISYSLEGHEALRLVVKSETDRTSADAEEETEVVRCIEFLYEELADGGQMSREELIEAAKQHGFGKGIAERALDKPGRNRRVLRALPGIKESREARGKLFLRREFVEA